MGNNTNNNSWDNEGFNDRAVGNMNDRRGTSLNSGNNQN